MYIDNIKKIESLINNYFEGVFYGDISKLKACFSINAYIYGDINSNEYCKRIDEYIGSVTVRKSPNDLNEKLEMSIIGIEVLGKIAMAKLHMPMLGYNYYDYLSLFKINDEWKIVNKIFKHVV